VATDWSAAGNGGRVLFTAFAALAGFMVVRAFLARRLQTTGAAPPTARYIDHLGFTLVALFDAFVVIAVLDASAPIWAVTGLGVLIAVAGHFAIRWAKTHLTTPRTHTRPPRTA